MAAASLPGRIPAYTLHKPSGQARVRIAGRDHYLGPYDSPESRDRYDRLISEWLASGRLAGARPGGPTVAELLARYWLHAEGYYRHPDGRPTSELVGIREALRPLRRLYGETRAVEFGPLALRALRNEMIRSGLARTTVNARVGKIRRAFRWAASHELIPASVPQALETVEGLRRGRTEAREPEPVRPVTDEHVEAALPHMPPTVAAMVRVQRLAGMRPAEVLAMSADELDTSDASCWVYTPGRHKAAHHGRERVVFLGPRAIGVIRPYLLRAAGGPLFNPRESERRRQSARRAARVTPMTPSQRARGPEPNPVRVPGDRYAVASYRRAIHRACEAAGVPSWSPHQLRHAAATEVRRRFGLEASQVVLGHAELGVTQVYAERDMARAREVMRQIG